MSQWEERFVDTRDRAAKRDFQAEVGHWQGAIYEVKFKRRVRGRTLSQNASYWACVIPALVAGIQEQWGQKINGETAHQMLKERFLRVETRHVDDDTGEVRKLCYTRSTTMLDVMEFSTYLEECINFIAEWFGIEVVIGYGEE